MSTLHDRAWPSAPQPGEPCPDLAAAAPATPWLAAMARTEQNPRYHAEGDVLRHTQLVAAELVADERWQALDAAAREELWVATLLHDAGKPATTRRADGRWTSPGHARRGAIMARRLLWEASFDIAARERICGLVRHHMAPHYLVDADPAVAVPRAIAISLEAGPGAYHQFLLTRADSLGRIASDRDAMVLNVDLFAEYCADLGCLHEAYPFASDHARFDYFTHPGRDPAYAAHDDTRSRVVVLSGLPGAGKDLWISRHGDGRPVVSLDDLRRARRARRGDSTAQGQVVEQAREMARVHLRAHEPFIWNATNLSSRVRAQTIGLLADYRAHVTIVSVEALAADLAHRNADREHPVPWPAIERMLESWEAPSLAECHELVRWSADS